MMDDHFVFGARVQAVEVGDTASHVLVVEKISISPLHNSFCGEYSSCSETCRRFVHLSFLEFFLSSPSMISFLSRMIPI